MRRTFPVYIARVYPGGAHCGHQHTRKAAEGCARNHLLRPVVEVTQVARVTKNGEEKAIATFKREG